MSDGTMTGTELLVGDTDVVTVQESRSKSEPCIIDIDVSPREFLDVETLTSLKDAIVIGLTDRSYLPKVNDLRSDWVASVAVPAFKAIANTGRRVSSFCTIGTGSGLDALAAIEILQPKTAAITDLHEDVVLQAEKNIRGGLRPGVNIDLMSGVGDVLAPIAKRHAAFDLIYENLPNIPSAGAEDIGRGQTSSTFLARRTELIPTFAAQYLLSLHYVALLQSRPMLAKDGKILSSIGGRIPLKVILELAACTSYHGKILTYSWKKQSEPKDVIGGYAAWEAAGLGPFHFYPVNVLEDVFFGIDAGSAGAQALSIEAHLERYRIGATAALEMLRRGSVLGHTVAVLECSRQEVG